MKKSLLILMVVFWIGNRTAIAQNSLPFNKGSVRESVNRVVKWQIDHYAEMDNDRKWKSNGDLSWENGVFHAALAQWAGFDKNEEFIKWYEDIADRNFWQPCTGKNTIYHADDMAVCLMYPTLYEKRKDHRIIDPTLARIEYIMNNPSPIKFGDKSRNRFDRWTWCDALYMAPPVIAAFANISGNDKLREFMDTEFWATCEFLYDKDEKLFYRDQNFFQKKENNGKKVFWGRGNAWVIGGLALTINLLPEDFHSKEKYIELFRDMMVRIAGLQDENGYWHASMLDPDSYPSPETSSTGFFTYGLWWGINNGILDKNEFLPYAVKGWQAMLDAIQPDGMLGWVQPIGHDPQSVTKNMTEVYGPAAMMRAAREITIFLNSVE